MQATARRLSVVYSKSTPRRRLIRDVRRTNSIHMNPETLVKPLGLIEKPIVEHGSSVAQGHFIKLLQAQPAVLKEGIVEREAKAALEAAKITQLLSEVEALKTELQKLQPPDRIMQKAEEILKFFFERAQEFTSEQVSAQFQLPRSVVESHFDVLEDKKLIKCSRPGISINGHANLPAFQITKEGRSYVNAHQ